MAPGGKSITDAESSIRCKKYPSGKVSLTFRFRSPSDRRGRKLTLGTWVPDAGDEAPPVLGYYVTLNGARVLVAQAKLALSRGRDVAAEHVAAKRKTREPDRVEPGSVFPDVAKAFVTKHCFANKQRRARNVAQTLGLQVDKKALKFSDTFTKGSPCDVWRNVAINELTKRQVLDLVDTFVEKGHRAAGLARWKSVRRCLRWALSRDIIQRSPLSETRPPVKSRARERTLEPHELRAMWRATLKLGDYGRYVRFLLLTMTRRNEPLRAPWSEFNADRTLWVIPSARTKNAVEHRLPLSPAAQDILAELPPDRPLVFGSLANANINRWKRKLDAEMRRLLEEDGHVFRPWVQHDLRRTGATLLAEHGVDAVVVGKLLNHQSALSPIARIYLRATYREPMRRAIEKLADLVLEIVGGA
jgi:integrase